MDQSQETGNTTGANKKEADDNAAANKKEAEDSGNAASARKRIAKVRIRPVDSVEDVRHVEGAGDYSNSAGKAGRRKKLRNIRFVNKNILREEDVTKWQTKCFFFFVAFMLGALGIGLTVYGVKKGLRDFKILGPIFLVLAFFLLVAALVLIIKDLILLNKFDFDDDPADVLHDTYPLPPMEDPKSVLKKSTHMELYSKRPFSASSSTKSDSALTATDVKFESEADLRQGPDVTVACTRIDQENGEDAPVKRVPSVVILNENQTSPLDT